MSILTKAQIIEKNGKPVFAVIPYEDYLALLPEESDQTIPHEVVGLVIKKNMRTSLIEPCRQHHIGCFINLKRINTASFSG